MTIKHKICCATRISCIFNSLLKRHTAQVEEDEEEGGRCGGKGIGHTAQGFNEPENMNRAIRSLINLREFNCCSGLGPDSSLLAAASDAMVDFLEFCDCSFH